MRLELRKRGKYWQAYGGAFRKSTGHTSERKARRLADAWEKELDDPDHFRANEATVDSAAERWMKELKASHKPPTVRFYDVKIRHVRRLLGAVRLAKLTHDKVLAYTEKRLSEGGHRHTIHRELTALRLTLKSAARAREFSRDPKSVIPRFQPGYEPSKHFVEPEAIWAAIAHLPQHRGAAVAWCIATACDFSAIWTAERGDVRPDRVLVRGSKTSTRTREVPRVKVMEPFLRHALAYAEPTPARLLFQMWHSMPRDLRRACRRAGVPEFTARTLRHSAATWLVRAGVPYEVAAKFLGHGSTIMLQRVYGNIAPPDAGRLIDERLP